MQQHHTRRLQSQFPHCPIYIRLNTSNPQLRCWRLLFSSHLALLEPRALPASVLTVHGQCMRRLDHQRQARVKRAGSARGAPHRQQCAALAGGGVVQHPHCATALVAWQCGCEWPRSGQFEARQQRVSSMVRTCTMERSVAQHGSRHTRVAVPASQCFLERHHALSNIPVTTMSSIRCSVSTLHRAPSSILLHLFYTARHPQHSCLLSDSTHFYNPSSSLQNPCTHLRQRRSG